MLEDGSTHALSDQPTRWAKGDKRCQPTRWAKGDKR